MYQGVVVIAVGTSLPCSVNTVNPAEMFQSDDTRITTAWTGRAVLCP